jgi:hypothetical protein
VKPCLSGLGSGEKYVRYLQDLGRLSTYQVFSPARQINMGNNTSKKKALWVKCKKPPVLMGGGAELFPGNSYNQG